MVRDGSDGSLMIANQKPFGTDAALKHRTKALEALFKIEIEFARLRDRLYIERMEEVVRDREAVEAGE